MHLDVLDLRSFYYRSSLGRAVQRVIRQELQSLWPQAEVGGMTVVGFGFAVPLLRPYLGNARRVIGLMPGPQGVMPWPAGQRNVSVLCEDTLWPLQSGSVDRLVVLHGLETSDHPAALLNECWRVLRPEGRAVFVVPNRAGLWSRNDATPFGFGRPYTSSQLESQLADHGFDAQSLRSALYQPPSTARFWRRFGGSIERVGHYVPALRAGGVLVLEALKEVPAPRRPGLAQRVRHPLSVLEGIGASEPQPAGFDPSGQLSS